MRTHVLVFSFLLLVPALVFGQLVFEPRLGGVWEFPDTEVDAVSVINLTVVNQGRLEFRILLNANPQEYTVTPNEIRLAAGAIGVFAVRFSPQRAGQVRGSMSGAAFADDMGQMLPETTLLGTGVEIGVPELRIEPEEILLEVTEWGVPDEEVLVVSNAGGEDLAVGVNIDSVAWLEINPPLNDFVVEPDGERRYTFSTTEELPENGDYATSIVLSTNDPDHREVEIAIRLSVDLPEVSDMVIELERGWNMISTNRTFLQDVIDDEGPDMQLILADIMDQLLIIKDGDGAFCAPDWDYWGIFAWETDRGYQVKVTEDTELTVTGVLIPWDTPIDLHLGWNLSAYYPDYEISDLEWALADLVERDLLIIAKDGYGRFVLPDIGFEGPPTYPGYGYQLKVTQNCSFTWAPEEDEQAAFRGGNPALDELQHFPAPVNTGSNMSVLIRQISGVDLIDGAEIACVTLSDLVAGAVAIDISEDMWGFPVWGDDTNSDERDGFLEQEALRFLYWDPETNWEREMAVEVTEGDLVYTVNSFLNISNATVNVSEDEIAVPASFGIKEIHPNPFNSTASLRFDVSIPGKTTLTLISLDGRQRAVFFDAIRTPGSYSAVIEAGDIPTGLYLIVLQNSGRSDTRKVVILR